MRLDLAPDLPHGLGDRGQLQQVVLNLVLNAFDAMSGAGAGARSLTIRTHCDGSHVIVEVRDSGTGIAQKDLDQIFEPLYTTKSEGLGMGLAIARTIVDAHGGRLGVTNNGDGGATFHFSLPVRQSAKQ
jgi:signal transduction histidine kinase